jgi:hypothetical protein
MLDLQGRAELNAKKSRIRMLAQEDLLKERKQERQQKTNRL